MEMMMSNINGDDNGAQLPLSLPIGFRFQPTDEELLFFYLKKKNLSLPLPPSHILQADDVFNTNPWDLPGEVREKRYLFSQRKDNVKRCGRVIEAGCGYWRIIGRDKLVVMSCNNSNKNKQLVDDDVGMKRYLQFYVGTHPTPWAMDQYCIARSVTCPYLAKNFITQTGDWVLCRVHQIKRRHETGQDSSKTRLSFGEADVMDSITNDNSGFRPPQASSSCSGGTNETSASDHQEITSHHLNHYSP